MKRSLRRCTILCAVLPQLLLALFAPALVVCQEADGARAVELGFTPCCATDSGNPAPAAEVGELADGCGGCEDATLVVSLQREDEPLHWDFTPQLQVAMPATQVTWPSIQSLCSRPKAPPRACSRMAAIRTVVFRC